MKYHLKTEYLRGRPWIDPMKVFVKGMGEAIVRIQPGDLLGRAALLALCELTEAKRLLPSAHGAEFFESDVDFNIDTDTFTFRFRRAEQEVAA